MPTDQDISEVRREQILEAATSVFARYGFHKARMDDIVEEAGLSKGAVYWYFDSKDEIIAEILERFLKRELNNLQFFLDERKSAGTRLKEIAQHLAGEFEKMAELMPIAYEFYAAATREEKIRQSINAYFDDYHQLLRGLIRQGIQEGEFRDVDPDQVATSLIALFEGLILLWVIGALDMDSCSISNRAQSALRLVLKGLES
jgi:AcrR family transcriptional regulator